MAPSKSKEIDGGDADLAKVRTLRTLGLVSELTENRVILGFPRIGQSGPFERLIGRDRGERTAAAMESQLTDLERKIDDLLASVDQESETDSAANVNVNQDDSNGSGKEGSLKQETKQ
ncbi:hypothetical protein MMC21_004612 [Puttea exsequens]|nr:hypothetical protein [Puttea exsequens]